MNPKMKIHVINQLHNDQQLHIIELQKDVVGLMCNFNYFNYKKI